MPDIIDLLANLDEHLQKLVQQNGGWVYALGCLVIFAETGLIFLAILPGDSLLFAAGSLAAAGSMDPVLTLTLFPLAAFLGDQANYGLGKAFGEKLFYKSELPFFHEKNLERTERFYAEHGAVTIIIGRFIPVVRSLAPFVAAASKMRYFKFIRYSIVGAATWAYLFLLLGYFFGKIPLVKDNFWMVIVAVIVLSCIPGIVSFIRANRKDKQ